MNRATSAVLSDQPFFSFAKRLFTYSDLGSIKGDQRQSVLSGPLEMTQVIRAYVKNLQSWRPLNTTVLHPTASAFRDAVLKIVMEIEQS